MVALGAAVAAPVAAVKTFSRERDRGGFHEMIRDTSLRGFSERSAPPFDQAELLDAFDSCRRDGNLTWPTEFQHGDPPPSLEGYGDLLAAYESRRNHRILTLMRQRYLKEA